MRGSRPHNPNAEHIVIDGIWFYKETKGLYYLGSVKDETGKPHPVRAHHYVWEKHYGKVPNGYSVHHIDKNPANNNIENLVLLSYSEHSHIHATENVETARQNIAKAIVAATDWHRSDLGNEWHKQHYDEITREIWNKPVVKKCVVCGKEFETVSSASKHSLYCSDYCKKHSDVMNKYRSEHQEIRVCPTCGKEFSVYKYARKVNCSRECANISQSRKKLGKSRQTH